MIVPPGERLKADVIQRWDNTAQAARGGHDNLNQQKGENVNSFPTRVSINLPPLPVPLDQLIADQMSWGESARAFVGKALQLFSRPIQCREARLYFAFFLPDSTRVLFHRTVG